MNFIRHCFYSIIFAHLLFPSGVYAAVPSYNIHIGITAEDFEGKTVAAIPQVANHYDFSGHHTSGETGLPTPSLPSTSNSADTDSDNIILTLRTNYFFSSNQSIDISYEYNQYALSGNVDIDGSQISLDYFYKF